MGFGGGAGGGQGKSARMLWKTENKLLGTLTLGLPNLEKLFKLSVHETQGIALGVLTQMLQALRLVIAYFSNQLDRAYKGGRLS